MSKKKIIVIIVFILLALGLWWGYSYVTKSKNATPTDTGTGTNFFADLLNFGKSKTNSNNGNGSTGDNTNTPPADVSGYTPPPETQMQKMKLMKISSMPVAGYTVFNTERYKDIPDATQIPADTTGTTTDTTKPTTKPKIIIPSAPPTELIPTLRYVAKATGNIFQTFVDTISESKFTDTIIPQVHEAYFGNNGENVIMRYLKDDGATIATFAGKLPAQVLGGDTTSSNEITGSFLPDNITDMSMSSDNTNIFYLFNSKSRAVGTTASTLGGNKSQVFDSGYTEWLSQWPEPNTITLTTKPSANVPGYMYIVDPNKKNFQKIIGKINGLTTLTSPDGNLVLYSGNDVSLHVYNINTKETKNISVRTLPEKCVWNKGSYTLYCAVPKAIDGSPYPDAWYMGKVSFSDDIWKIDALSGIASKILDPLLEDSSIDPSIQNTQPIDGIKLGLDENESHLFFINKVDSFLWGLELK